MEGKTLNFCRFKKILKMRYTFCTNDELVFMLQKYSNSFRITKKNRHGFLDNN